MCFAAEASHTRRVPRPTTKEALLERYNKIKRRSTPQSSPACSDDAGSVNERSDLDDDDDGESNVDLVFGDGDSSLESSDNESENDESMMESEEIDNE